MADPTCGARFESGPDLDHLHVCNLGPDHPHIRNHVCHCGYVWLKVDRAPRATNPTATQLYDAVKAKRAAACDRVLTIPEINSVLVARAEFVAGVAAGPQATPPLPDPGRPICQRCHISPPANGFFICQACVSDLAANGEDAAAYATAGLVEP